jgi:DNA-binding NarL/FixJ family response regulator
VRILIADDHEVVRKGICSILEARKNIDICGEASNGEDAVEKASQLNPDLIILDVTTQPKWFCRRETNQDISARGSNTYTFDARGSQRSPRGATSRGARFRVQERCWACIAESRGRRPSGPDILSRLRRKSWPANRDVVPFADEQWMKHRVQWPSNANFSRRRPRRC